MRWRDIMRLSVRRRPPEGAHGRSHGDGSYFAIWACPNEHHGVGGPSSPPEFECCGPWTHCTRDKAHAFIEELEGRERAHDGIAFTLL